MTLAREGDLRENLLVRQGRGSFQLSGAGHEAISALALLIGKGDLIFPAYRDRAMMHALGMTALESAQDFFGVAGSSSEGRNLPGHFSSRLRGVFSITSPVAAQCLPAVGAAWGMKMEGISSVVLCHIGDAATRQGEFFEAVAQAVQDRLPVVFVVEDNGYGISTPTRGTTPLALGMLPPATVITVNGRDAGEVHDQGAIAIAKARAGDGPTVLWCDLDRLSNHTNADDHRMYRSMEEIDEMASRDPLERLTAKLIDAGELDEATWERMRTEVAEEVRAAYTQVERLDASSPDRVIDQLYGPATESYPPLTLRGEATTMLQAVNATLRAGLEANGRTILFGEDIEDPKGGVFGITKGLSNDFARQVVNSPLAEATIVGTGVGLAATGWRPVFELQFIDFVGPAFNQLISQVTNLRWRTNGDWKCPLVIYAPCGAYLPNGGMWHSQSNEGWFAGMPGLRVAVPSTPEDAAGLMWSAMHDDDPSLVLLPKHLLRATQPVRKRSFQGLRWGQGRLVKEGTDATIVAWGNCVEVAQAAAEILQDEGVNVEIVDPRTLVPCDWNLVAESVARTGRLIVVQEDSKTCGFGQAVVSEMTTSPERFALLRSAPQLVSRPDVHIPFVASLESAILPSISDVVRAVRATMSVNLASTQSEEGLEVQESDSESILTVPQLGEGLRTVLVTAHLKKPGDHVAMDEPLYEVETDKANVAVESSIEGTLVEWFVEVNKEAEVHAPIARIEGTGTTSLPKTENPRGKERDGYDEHPLSNRQRAMNRSALGGRLDLPLPASVGRPLLWARVEEARQRLRTQYPKLRLTEFGVFAYAAARATQSHPKFRSTLVSRGETVRRFDHVDLGFAIALPDDELVTAVIRSADQLSFGEFADEMRARHREAKAGATQSDARTTLLISSLAGHEVVDAAPVLFPPAIATLFVGAPSEGPNGRAAYLRLAFDHRLINGVGAAEYLQGIEKELARFGIE
jgi:2-oxoisovalerate dehydrogenase E1 component